MKCKKVNCRTILSEVANLGEYCFIHALEQREQDEKDEVEANYRKKYAKGYRLTRYILVSQSLDFAMVCLKRKKTKIVYKTIKGNKCHALVRYN